MTVCLHTVSVVEKWSLTKVQIILCRCTFSCGHVACVPAGIVKEVEVLMQEVSDTMDIKCLTNKQTVQSYQAVEYSYGQKFTYLIF